MTFEPSAAYDDVFMKLLALIILLQRTLQIWGFAIELVFRLWWVKRKFTYGKQVNIETSYVIFDPT